MGRLVELLIQISWKEVAVAGNLNNLTRLFYLQLKVGKVSKVHINPWMMYRNFQ